MDAVLAGVCLSWQSFDVVPGAMLLYRPTGASEENTAGQTVDLTGRLALHR